MKIVYICFEILVLICVFSFAYQLGSTHTEKRLRNEANSFNLVCKEAKKVKSVHNSVFTCMEFSP